MFWFFFPFQVFTDIYFLFPVAMVDLHVALSYYPRMFNSAKISPLVSVSIISSMMNKSFYLCRRRCAVVSHIDRVFSRMNCHVRTIQEGVMLWYKACKLLEKRDPYQLISIFLSSIRSRRWLSVVVVMTPWYIRAQICFFPCIP